MGYQRIKSTLALLDLVTKLHIDLDACNCLDHLQQFNKNSRESCLAGLYLHSVGLKCSQMEWWSLLNQKCFKMARSLLNGLETLTTIPDEHWKSICQNSCWKYKVVVSYSSSNDAMKIGTISKAIFSKMLINSHYLVSP